MSADVKVLSITGYTRSGSTLLDTILGSIQGFFSTGELHYLWERGLVQGRRCGCGELIPRCPTWSAILANAFPEGTPAPERVIALQERCARTRHTPRLLSAEEGREQNPALSAYVDVMRRLYAGIAVTTGASVIVDSSKRPSDAAIARLVPGVSAYAVHLVRDPRAVVHSWSRTKAELDRPWATSMPKQSLLFTTFGWAELNAMSELVRRRYRDRATLIRYEDLARAADGYVARILDVVEESGRARPVIRADRVRVAANHTVSGNPGRFHTGVLSIRPDDEWRSATSGPRHAAITILTMPLLLRYGYGLGRGGPS